MNTLARVVRLVVLIAGLVQLGSTECSQGVYRTCLACPLVSHPRECNTFTEVWPHEQCTADILRLLNGSTAYSFGFENAIECVHPEIPASPHARQQRMASTDISICHECCTESLCNRKLCGMPEGDSTNLACLFGNDVSGLPLDTAITYCNVGEQCYTERPQDARPNDSNNYGCASQATCDNLVSGSADDESSTCRKCCAQDGCNAQICQPQDPQGTTVSPIDTTQSATIFTDCWDLRHRGGFNENGIYDIYPAPAHTRLRVRCDMTTDGGGWIILQRRYDGSLDFNRTFQEYEEGFGVDTGERWLGLKWMHVLTSQHDNPVVLRVDLCSFYGQAGYAMYAFFSISNQSETYQFIPGRYTGGNLVDDLSVPSMSDRFYAKYPGDPRFEGSDIIRRGWWYDGLNCPAPNLNCKYNATHGEGLVWSGFGSDIPTLTASVRSSEMKIRPLYATGDHSSPYVCPP